MILRILQKTIIALGVTSFLLMTIGGGFFVFASESGIITSDEKNLLRIESEWERYQKSVELKYSERIHRSQDRLDELREELEGDLLEFDKQNKIIDENERTLRILRSKLTTLRGQLEIISANLTATQEKIANIEEQISVKESKIAKVMEEKEKIAAETEYQREIVLSYFELLQTETEAISADDSQGIRIILSEDSFSKSLRNEMHFSAMEKTARQIFHDLEGSMSQLDEVNYILSQEHEKLQDLHSSLEVERKTLALQHQAQEQLVTETAGEEEKFQALLRESRMQMEESAMQIAQTKEDMAYIKEQLNLLEVSKKNEKNKLTESRLQEILEDDANYDIGDLFDLQNAEDKPLTWPVPPVKITAQFQDASYKSHFGVAHNAIDIRAAQGSNIYAPAAGYVYKVVDNGMGYSYLILIHKENLMTVYGHVSQFLVEEGDLVQLGDVVAKTGGTPGTKGAGVMTTGAHLHFEVWKDGEVQNPLDYLPLGVLNPEDIPKEYLVDYLDLQEGSVTTSQGTFKMGTGETKEERVEEFVREYCVEDVEKIWKDVYDYSESQGIDGALPFAIALADSGCGKNLLTDYNYGNVGNNDRGDTRGFTSPLEGMKAIVDTLNNNMLGGNDRIGHLSGGGRIEMYSIEDCSEAIAPYKCYASSKANWHSNVIAGMTYMLAREVSGFYIYRIQVQQVAEVDTSEDIEINESEIERINEEVFEESINNEELTIKNEEESENSIDVSGEAYETEDLSSEASAKEEAFLEYLNEEFADDVQK